jgi:hypothetical protein
MTQELRQRIQQGLSSFLGQVSNMDLRFLRKPDKHTEVNGVRQTMSRSIKRENGDATTVYTACEWLDEATGNTRYSCNCPGWSIHKKNEADRWCKHTKELAGNSSLNDVADKIEATKEVRDEPIEINSEQVAIRRQRRFS